MEPTRLEDRHLHGPAVSRPALGQVPALETKARVSVRCRICAIPRALPTRASDRAPIPPVPIRETMAAAAVRVHVAAHYVPVVSRASLFGSCSWPRLREKYDQEIREP